MGRLLFLVIIGATAWWAYQNGIFESVGSNFTPKAGKEAEVCGPFSEGTYFAQTVEDIVVAMDAKIGTESDKLLSAERLANFIRRGKIAKLEDHTRVKIADNDDVRMHGVTHHITKVELLDGDYAGNTGWVQREDVIDTPIQEWNQKLFRSGKRVTREQLKYGSSSQE